MVVHHQWVHSVVTNSVQPHGPGTSVLGIFQARIQEWVTIPSLCDLPHPGVKPRSPAIQADSLPLSYQGFIPSTEGLNKHSLSKREFPLPELGHWSFPTFRLRNICSSWVIMKTYWLSNWNLYHQLSQFSGLWGLDLHINFSRSAACQLQALGLLGLWFLIINLFNKHRHTHAYTHTYWFYSPGEP